MDSWYYVDMPSFQKLKLIFDTFSWFITQSVRKVSLLRVTLGVLAPFAEAATVKTFRCWAHRDNLDNLCAGAFVM